MRLRDILIEEDARFIATRDEVLKRYDDVLRVRAYYLWEAVGRPEGRDLEFWLQADRTPVTWDDLERAS